MQPPIHPETFDTRKLAARRAREAAARRAEGERLAAHVRRVLPPVLRAHGVERA